MPKPKLHFNLDLVNALRLGMVRVREFLGEGGGVPQLNRKGVKCLLTGFGGFWIERRLNPCWSRAYAKRNKS